MRKTSEKSVETNILHALVGCLEERTKVHITIISPTQEDENLLGYDDILQGLPPGKVVAIQFKRPLELQNREYARFSINRPQLDTFRQNFRNWGNAFYIFPPFPTHRELIQHRPTILQDSFFVDVHNMPLMQNQNTFSVRVHKNPGWIEFPIDRQARRIYIPLKLEWLCQKIASCKLGSMINPSVGDSSYFDEKPSPKNKKKKLKNVFYLHIPKKQNKKRKLKK